MGTSRSQASAVDALVGEPLLRVDDVAYLLGVPCSTVYSYVRREQAPLPCLRVGRHLRFERAAVQRWLRSTQWGR